MKNLLFILLISFLAISCQKPLTKYDVILKIGDLEVTNYTLHKKVQRVFPDPAMKNAESLDKFREDFINSYFIIADAYAKKYDTLSHIQTKLRYNRDYTMVKRQGHLWETIVGPRVYDSMQVTPDKEAKRSMLYYFDIIHIGNIPEFFRLTGNDSILENHEEFLALKSQCPDHLFLNSTASTLQWPFGGLKNHAGELMALEPGEVSPMMTIQGNGYFFCLDSKEQIRLTEEEKNKFSYELQASAERLINDEKDQEMLRHGQPEINENTLASIADYLKEGNKLEDFPHNPHVMSYLMDRVHKEVYFQDYLQPMQHYPSRVQIENQEQFRESLIEFFYTDYLIQEAHDLGLYKSDTFAFECKSLLNSYVYYEYIDQEIRNTVQIDTAEVVHYYTDHQQQYKEPEKLLLHCYFFDDEGTAFNNLFALMEFYQNNDIRDLMNTKHLYNLKYTLPNHQIATQDTLLNTKQLINTLKYLQLGQVSEPLPYMDQYALFVRVGQEGEVPIELEAVYPYIEDQLIEEKTQELLKKRHAELKRQYSLNIEKIDTKLL